MARNACTWVNSNINVGRLVSIAAVFAHYDCTNMVNVFYNDGKMSPDVLTQTAHLALNYEIFTLQRNVPAAWHKDNEKMPERLSEIAARGEIVSVCSLENGKEHHENLTIVWYKRSK